MTPGEDDDDPTSVSSIAPDSTAETAVAEAPAPVAEKAPPKSVFERVADQFPDLTGAQMKAVTSVIEATNLPNPEDALILAKSKHPNLWPSATVRTATNTTPTRTGQTPVKRELSPREAAEEVVSKARAELVTSAGGDDRLDRSAALIRAKRELRGLR